MKQEGQEAGRNKPNILDYYILFNPLGLSFMMSLLFDGVYNTLIHSDYTIHKNKIMLCNKRT